MLLVVCLAPLLLSRESTPPARPALQRSQSQHTPAARPEWVLHDHFNLAALPVAVGLSAGSLCGAGGRTDLALTAYMLAYFTTDTLWIAARPAIVRTPRTLLFHHALTLLLLLHPLVYPPHRRYTAWMTIVELNTWLLVARRHFKRWRLALDTVFGITWVRAARRIVHHTTLPRHTNRAAAADPCPRHVVPDRADLPRLPRSRAVAARRARPAHARLRRRHHHRPRRAAARVDAAGARADGALAVAVAGARRRAGRRGRRRQSAVAVAVN